MENGLFYTTEEGTSQGGIISPSLMVMTLAGLERTIREASHNKGWKVNFIGYADDFVVTGATKEVLENNIKPIITEFLKERGLTLSEEKTRATHIDDGFDFLGFNFKKYKG